jgi:uncharacterized protein YggT (Ycf19 family)
VALIDFLLNLAGLLLWLNWRAIRGEAPPQIGSNSLAGLLKPAEPTRARGWLLLVALFGLLGIRAILYYQLGSATDWTPRLSLGIVALAFRSDRFGAVALFSLLSFLRLLLITYFWLVVLALLDNEAVETSTLQRNLRLQVGRVARWPWWTQLVVPLLLTVALWLALHPLLMQIGTVSSTRNFARLTAQGLLVSSGLILSLKYLLPPLLLLHMVSSYVYLGENPAWGFISQTSRRLVLPLRKLRLQLGKFDLAPLLGAALLVALLHWLPNVILNRLAHEKLTLWPE